MCVNKFESAKLFHKLCRHSESVSNGNNSQRTQSLLFKGKPNQMSVTIRYKEIREHFLKLYKINENYFLNYFPHDSVLKVNLITETWVFMDSLVV